MKSEFPHKNVSEGQRLADEYPWFDIPAIARYETGGTLPRRIAVQYVWRTPSREAQAAWKDIVDVASRCDAGVGEATEVAGAMAIIEEFINSGEHRITPQENTPDEPLAAVLDELPPDELLTEDLASIYLVQGLTVRAVEIYRRLSLLNPEKSAYFADIIDKAQAAETADSDKK